MLAAVGQIARAKADVAGAKGSYLIVVKSSQGVPRVSTTIPNDQLRARTADAKLSHSGAFPETGGKDAEGIFGGGQVLRMRDSKLGQVMWTQASLCIFPSQRGLTELPGRVDLYESK